MDLENGMKDGVLSSSFSLFMGSASAFVNLSCQFGENSFQVCLVVPTTGEGPHILLDSLRILFGNLVFAMDGEGHEALQLHRCIVINHHVSGMFQSNEQTKETMT